MTLLKTIILAGIICLSFPLLTKNAHAIDEDKKQVIKELLDASGTKKLASMMGEASSQNVLNVIKTQNPETPERVFTVIDEEVKKLFQEEFDSGSFYNLIYPIYDEKFTTQELKEILAFYQTDVGKKVTKELPEITQKAMIAGQIWGQGLSPKIQSRVRNRLEAEGF
ncbi:MAG: DUF2059 domain-containing protein [Bdellovibrionales bacterium]